MSVLYIIIITLVIYSAIATLVYIISKENETVAIAFGLGVVGLTLAGVLNIIRAIKRQFKYNIGLRSIFEEESTGNRYKCKVKDSEDIRCWVEGYNLLMRYAPRSECIGIPDFSKEFIINSKRNCDHCKHNKPDECMSDYPHDKVRCKHDEYGRVLEFDKFESKNEVKICLCK